MKRRLAKPNLSRRRFLLDSSVAGLLAGVGMLPLATNAQLKPLPGGVMRIGLSHGPGRLNPLLARNDAEYLLGEMLYSGLTRLAVDMSPVPDLAESWQASDDFREWTFILRQGVKFHHGPTLTARDVVASVRALLNTLSASTARHGIGPIAAVEALNDYTVRFVLRTPYADLPSALANPVAKIVPADILTADAAQLDSEAFGTGPFTLTAFEPAGISVVERNPDYFIPEQPYMDAVEVLVYPTAAVAVAALLRADIDLALAVPPVDFAQLEATPAVDGLRIPSGRFVELVLANDVPPFNDKRVRQALQLSLDREALVAGVAKGYGRPAYDTPIAPAARFYRAVPPIGRDVSQARALLAAAGFPDGLTIRLLVADQPPIRNDLALAVRDMAAPAGFNIVVQTIPYDLDQVWKNSIFYIGYYAMQPSEDAVFSLYTSAAGWSQASWGNAEFDELIAQARSVTDESRRAELYGAAQALMREEVPTVIPLYLDLLAAKRSYVEDFQLHPRGAVFAMHKVWLGSGSPKRR